jgi:hypothetical protein
MAVRKAPRFVLSGSIKKELRRSSGTIGFRSIRSTSFTGSRSRIRAGGAMIDHDRSRRTDWVTGGRSTRGEGEESGLVEKPIPARPSIFNSCSVAIRTGTRADNNCT